jgi:hypothetical protein
MKREISNSNDYQKPKGAVKFSFLILLILSLGVSIYSAENYSSWGKAIRINLNTTSSGANISQDVFNFPILIRLNCSNFQYFSTTLPGGADIRFTKANGVHLPYHIERWVDSPDNKDVAEIWVRMDTVKGNNCNQYILMYWQKSNVYDSSKSSAVFDTGIGFSGVWHLNQNPAGSAPQVLDATLNCINGSSRGCMTSGNLVDGMIGKGIAFDGINDYINFGNGPKIDIVGHSDMTISAWAKLYIRNDWNAIVGKGDHQYHIQFRPHDEFCIFDGTDWRGAYNLNEPAIVANTWYYITGTYNGLKDSLFLYRNGIRIAAAKADHIGSGRDDSLTIGINSENMSRYFNGIIDEVRLARACRSQDWIRLEYENQKQNQSLITLDQTPIPPPNEDLSTWLYSSAIYLNTSATGANVLNNVRNFPILIRLDPSIFKDFAHTLPNGADLRFGKADNTVLPFQIERWIDGENNNDTAEVWVQLDTVYGNSISQYIKIFWGKSEVASTSDGSAVFDTANAYTGAWHMNQNPGGASPQIMDATVNGINGYSRGAMNSSNLASGIIGKGIYFDGINDYISFGNGPKVDIAGNANITISAWVKLSTRNEWNAIFGKGDHQYHIQFRPSYVHDEFCIFDDTDWRPAYSMSQPEIATNTWYYIAGTYNQASDTLSLYRNGKLIATSKADHISSARDDSLAIGVNSEYMSRYINGIIDEVQLSKTARSADWIKLSYENQKLHQTLVGFGNIPIADNDGDGVPDFVEAALDFDPSNASSKPTVAIPNSWLNKCGESKTVGYTLSGFAPFSMEIPCGVLSTGYNPIIELKKVSEIPDLPVSNGEEIRSIFNIVGGIAADQKITFAFPFTDNGKLVGLSSFKLYTYDESSGKWERIAIAKIQRNSVYADLCHFSLYVLTFTDNVITVNCQSQAANPDGKTWETAFSDLQTALAAAKSNSMPNEIWVAKGTYKPTTGNDRNATFTLEQGSDPFNKSMILGGFTRESNFAFERDYNVNTTNLSGDIGIAGFNNSFKIVTGSSNAILDGFTICNGSTGIAISGCANIDILNCNAINNVGGGNGGGMQIESSTGIKVERCTFSSNGSMCGGGLFAENSSDIQILSTIFFQNQADGGGGLEVFQCASLSINNSILYRNKAQGQDGGGILTSGNSNLFIKGCTFSDNSANSSRGGAIFAYTGSIDMKNTILWNNSAATSGSEIHNNISDIKIGYSDISGGVNGSGFAGNPVQDLGHNDSRDPQFQSQNNLQGSDGQYFTYDDGLRLKVNSPCFSTGTWDGQNPLDIKDILGQVRTTSQNPDMGAYWATLVERTGEPIDFIALTNQNYGFDKDPSRKEIYISIASTLSGQAQKTAKVYLILQPGIDHGTTLQLNIKTPSAQVFKIMSNGQLLDALNLDATINVHEITLASGILNKASDQLLATTSTGGNRSLDVWTFFEKTVLTNYYAIEDGNSPNTCLGTSAIQPNVLSDLITDIYKQAVLRCQVSGKSKMQVSYDFNKNGILDIWYFNGTPPGLASGAVYNEQTPIINAISSRSDPIADINLVQIRMSTLSWIIVKNPLTGLPPKKGDKEIFLFSPIAPPNGWIEDIPYLQIGRGNSSKSITIKVPVLVSNNIYKCELDPSVHPNGLEEDHDVSIPDGSNSISGEVLFEYAFYQSNNFNWVWGNILIPAAHEGLHTLGLPDLFDISSTNNLMYATEFGGTKLILSQWQRLH